MCCLRLHASCNSERCQGLDVFCKKLHASATLTEDGGASQARCNACGGRFRQDSFTLTFPQRHTALHLPGRGPSLIVGKHTAVLRIYFFDRGRQVRSDHPPQKKEKRLSGSDRAVKAAQLDSLSWLVA